jgi:hypothetical protein
MPIFLRKCKVKLEGLMKIRKGQKEKTELSNYLFESSVSVLFFKGQID